ncbi:MAG: protein kinase [Anaerolineae bacterium]|nr:protein kinase [Anaerolineae bacterium]
MVTNSWHGHIIIANRYHLLHPLGRGGMGSVMLARDTRFNQRFVALKENLNPSREAREQFRWEAEVLATLSYPHLPAVTDHFITTDGQQFLVMNYVEGESLEERVARAGPLSEVDALLWLGQVLDALHYLHTQPQPIIHRDVKPANIRITPEGRAVLVDFGISKIMVPGQQTATVARAGSPGYAPLEQYTGGTDARSDVYGVGATLYFALTGQEPPESLQLASGYALPRPRDLNGAISGRTEKIVLRAMQQNMGQRYQSVSDMRAALGASTDRLRTNDPITGVLKQGRRFSGRQWAILGGVVSLVLLVIVGMVWVLSLGEDGRASTVAPRPTLVHDPTVTRQMPKMTSPPSSSGGKATSTPMPSPSPEPANTPGVARPTSTLGATSASAGYRGITLLSPTLGEIYENPIAFSWSADLRAGEAYRGMARHTETGYVMYSDALQDANWLQDLPLDKTGEWWWKVDIVSGGNLVASSQEIRFILTTDIGSGDTGGGGGGGGGSNCHTEEYECNCSTDPVSGSKTCETCTREVCE